MTRTAVLSLLVGLLAMPATGSGQATGAKGPFEVVKAEQDLMLTMRDGVRLATDIYRPARNGQPVDERLPVLMSRTPYDKEGAGLVAQARFFAENGYVVVLQDTRGRFKSEGVFSKYYPYDAPDGFDTIEQVAKLTYADGQVGMWGTSYGAHTQADAAKLNPPALKTIVVNMGGLSNAWSQKVRSGGAFELGQQLGWAFGQLEGETDNPAAQAIMEVEKVEDWFAAMPFRRGLSPLSVVPNFEEYVLNMIQRGDYQYYKGIGENWSEFYEGTADIPMLHLSGWYDSYAGGTIDNFLALSKMKRSPMRLVMGPWTHGGNARSYSGNVEFGPGAAINDFPREYHLRWFDHHLKKRPTGVENEPTIKLFVMGTGDGSKNSDGRLVHGGYWRTSDAWPLPGTRMVNYYFHADGTLSPQAPEGQVAPTTYTFDPRHPVPTIGGAFSGALPGGAFDQRENEKFPGSRVPYLPLKSRSDVVVFQTDPLAEDVEVVGPIVVKLFASSDALDTDFTIKLVDVYPPSADFPSGYEMNLTDDILRARYRSSPEREELMQPGTVYELNIEAFPTANIFRRGHRIRVDISSSNFPRFDVNPNTGDPLGQHRRMIEANNSIHHSGTHRSHVILPIVPSAR